MATKTRKKGISPEKIYQEVTDRIIAALDEGTVPWKRPWKVAGAHRNLISKKNYRGINQWLLDLTAAAEGYSSPWWMTYNQAEGLGGNVKKGEKSTMIVFFKPIRIETDEVDRFGKKIVKTIPLLKYHRVFNLEQTENIDPKKVPVEEKGNEFTPVERAEKLIAGMPKRPELQHGGDRAYYRPSEDYIRLPKQEQFDSAEHYYSTSFHEHIHSTGHESRVGRKEVEDVKGFGGDPYAKEELVAEMGAAMLMALTGIEVDSTKEATKAYCQNWGKRFKEDRKLVVSAGAAAQRACDFIQDIKYEANSDA